MSDFTVTGATTSYFSWKPPDYECPKHGRVDGVNGTVNLLINGVPASKHCMKCYQQWIIANVPEVKEIK